MPVNFCRHLIGKNSERCLSLYDSASEVTTLWRYANLFIIVIILIFRPSVDIFPRELKILRCTKLGTDLSVRAVRGWQAVM